MHNTEKPKRIHLLGSGRHEEDTAAEAITPGHLLATNSEGRVLKHNVAGGRAEAKFALEDALQGRTIDDAYATGELVASVQADKGDVVYAWLAEGEHATPDEFLTSNGDGTLKVVTGTDHAIAKAMEEVDASDSGAEGDNRIKVRVL